MDKAVLDTRGGIPLFHQVAVLLRDQILSGVHAEGDRLPSEAEICEAFGVSRITAKRALDELAAEGLVVRSRGRGTLVQRDATVVPFEVSVDGWIENISRMGEMTTVELLEFDYRRAPQTVARELEIAPDTEVQRSIRVRARDGVPLSWLETWVPAQIGRSYTAEDMGAMPLLHLLERAGVKVAAAQQTITAALAAPHVAQALGVQAGAALLDVRRVVRDRAGRPVEYISILYRPDLYRFAMNLTRVAGDGGARWKADSPPASPAETAPG
ncbi:MAG: GntR family transcriptional regulator [Paracoccaceae bacterium]|nr:GntR family transcriptional regulator [Paracoccaceae bacterium]MDE3122895.1 GntR family transcriptional regulator [Paracoccaceae bacterium]MDE3237738.1 GntR family transcriptional regulator [Paracoccaceae bacterium]